MKNETERLSEFGQWWDAAEEIVHRAVIVVAVSVGTRLDDGRSRLTKSSSRWQ